MDKKTVRDLFSLRSSPCLRLIIVKDFPPKFSYGYKFYQT